MSVDPNETPELRANKQKLMAYIMGYRRGAGGGAFTKEDEANPDWKRGWVHGRTDKQARYAQACRHYGAELSIIRELKSPLPAAGCHPSQATPVGGA